ncbi:hypothetical protein SAMN04487982_110160 [Streptomyces sp. ok210]|nr:hypothetical protein SAMN04487982_110160 [Streptomyces sp. ok210]
MRDNHGVQTSKFPSVRALDQLLDGLGAGAARRRQLDMVRGELERALNRGALPVPARQSLQRLLEEEALRPYVRLAESGALRHRRVAAAFPPTSQATNEIRRKCIDLLREALGMPALRLGGGEIPLQPAPEAATLSALTRQLDQYLGGAMSPAQMYEVTCPDCGQEPEQQCTTLGGPHRSRVELAKEYTRLKKAHS